MDEALAIHDAYRRGDLTARTRIDDRATPLEEMEILGNAGSAAFLRKAMREEP